MDDGIRTRVYIPFDDGSAVSYDGMEFTVYRRPVEIDEDLSVLSEGLAAFFWRERRGDIVKALETAWWRQYERHRAAETKRIYTEKKSLKSDRA